MKTLSYITTHKDVQFVCTIIIIIKTCLSSDMCVCVALHSIGVRRATPTIHLGL